MSERKTYIPLSKRGQCGAIATHTLFSVGKIYVMDNHRMAPWCWQRHLGDHPKIDLVHIDRHHDCCEITKYHRDEWGRLDRTSLDCYLDARLPENRDVHLIQWDNFIPLFLASDGKRVGRLVLSSVADGTVPARCHELHSRNDHIRDLSSRSSDKQDRPFILDVDLDYFVFNWFSRYRRQTDSRVKAFCQAIASAHKTDTCLCMTVALSPSTCGDKGGQWRRSEHLLSLLSEEIGEDLSLMTTGDPRNGRHVC